MARFILLVGLTLLVAGCPAPQRVTLPEAPATGTLDAAPAALDRIDTAMDRIAARPAVVADPVIQAEVAVVKAETAHVRRDVTSGVSAAQGREALIAGLKDTVAGLEARIASGNEHALWIFTLIGFVGFGLAAFLWSDKLPQAIAAGTAAGILGAGLARGALQALWGGSPWTLLGALVATGLVLGGYFLWRSGRHPPPTADPPPATPAAERKDA